MSILDRAALEQSPLADLHAIASELSLDGYRRLRKDALIEAILERQGGVPASADAGEDANGEPAARRRRGRRGGRTRAGEEAAEAAEVADAAEATEAAKATEAAETTEAEAEPAAAKPARRRRRGSRDEDAQAPSGAVAEAEVPAGEPDRAAAEGDRGEPTAEGVVEVLPNGSAFLRVNPPEPSDDDVYISAAQVKRCELVSGDRIAGPRRAPRRSERFASLVRVDTVNGRPASELADSARFDELPAGFPVERFRLGSDDPTLKAIEFLTPFGRGSRVTVAGPAQSGKTETLRRLAVVLAADEEAQLLLALAGVRPEEVAEWTEAGLTPAAAMTSAASPDAQAQAVERVLDQARRLAARGNHVVLVVDSLSGLTAGAARRALASARRIVDGGSLTVIAAASEAVGGETTVIALDAALTAARRLPALDLRASWTMRAELLVGEGGAELIVRTRAEALDLG